MNMSINISMNILINISVIIPMNIPMFLPNIRALATLFLKLWLWKYSSTDHHKENGAKTHLTPPSLKHLTQKLILPMTPDFTHD